MLKYSLGLDISSKEIHCCLSTIDSSQKVSIKGSRTIANTFKGFKDLEDWVIRHRKQKEIPLVICMEATGVYYENCAMYLSKAGFPVSVLLPNYAKRYLQASGVKSKNDKIDAQGLAQMGAEKSLELWEPISEFYYSLRLLTREIENLQEQKTVVINQMHALQHAMHQNKVVNKTLLNRLKLIEKQLEDLEMAIQEHIDSNKEIAEKVRKICKIKGVGIRTVATLIAETNGFKLFKNARQLVSFAGYDIVENQSGSHHGRTRISKKGNSHIRRILHLPAFGVVRWKVGPFEDLYERTYAKHGIKMKSYVAVQKKLLVITYSLWKNDQEYDGKYKNKYNKQEEKELSIQEMSIVGEFQQRLLSK
ncbi:MAG: Transposase family protein [Sphingobacterium multivorum]|jgi:transposase|nr:Transposase family protein [Sphingobacterium multivorum]